MIHKCLFPVAGYGTRFLPATKSSPKEMLPVVNKPLIEYAVQEAVDAGLTRIGFVTGRGKRAIEDHFDKNYELNKQKNMIALKSFCKNTLIMEYDSEWFNENWVDMARDLAHPGIKTNALLKNKVLDLIKKY